MKSIFAFFGALTLLLAMTVAGVMYSSPALRHRVVEAIHRMVNDGMMSNGVVNKEIISRTTTGAAFPSATALTPNLLDEARRQVEYLEKQEAASRSSLAQLQQELDDRIRVIGPVSSLKGLSGLEATDPVAAGTVREILVAEERLRRLQTSLMNARRSFVTAVAVDTGVADPAETPASQALTLIDSDHRIREILTDVEKRVTAQTTATDLATKLRAELDEVRREKKAFAAEADRQKSRAEKLNEQLQQAMSTAGTLSHVQASIDDFQARNAALTAEVRAKDTLLFELRSRIDYCWKSSRTELEAKRLEMQALIHQRDDVNIQLSSIKQQLRVATDSLADRIRQQAVEVSEWSSRYNQAVAAHRQADTEIERLKSEFRYDDGEPSRTTTTTSGRAVIRVRASYRDSYYRTNIDVNSSTTVDQGGGRTLVYR